MLEAVLLTLAWGGAMRSQKLAGIAAEQQARTDSLTGLANRRAFNEAAQRAWHG